MQFPALVATLILVGSASAQAGVIDQSVPFSGAYSAYGGPFQQQVRAEAGGVLEGVTLWAFSPAGIPGIFQLDLLAGPAWNTGTPLWSGSFHTVGLGFALWEEIFVDCAAAGISLEPGDDLVLQITGPNSSTARFGCGAGYPHPFLSGPGNPGWGALAFETYMLPASPGLSLGVTGTCPLVGSVQVGGATPGGLVALATSPMTGALLVPRGVCAGTVISLKTPTLRAVLQADAAGALTIAVGTVPSAACGVLRLQAIDLTTCVLSDVLLL